MLSNSTPLKHRRSIWPWVILGTLVIILAELLFSLGAEIVLAAMSGLMGTAYFIHRSHAEHASFMKELFEYFNDRYDRQNNDLQKLLRKADDFDEDDEAAFVDYFNLCAEEWVFRKAGYIYDPVWQAWKNGMRQYGRDPRVAQLWAVERATGSYYGFEFPTDDPPVGSV